MGSPELCPEHQGMRSPGLRVVVLLCMTSCLLAEYIKEVCRKDTEVCLLEEGRNKGETIVYWTALSKMRKGPVTMKVSKTESNAMIESLATKTRDSNKATVNSKFSVEAQAAGFKAAASLSAGYEYFTETNRTKGTKLSEKMTERMESTTVVPAGFWGLVVAEMKMFVYRTEANGRLNRMTAPTGMTFVSAFNEDSLKNHILDSTFASAARAYGLTVLDEEGIANLVPDNLVPVLDSTSSVAGKAASKFQWPLPPSEEVYEIFNTIAQGSRLGAYYDCKDGKWCSASCFTSNYNYDYNMWGFVRQSDGTYMIINAGRADYRLTEPTRSQAKTGRQWAYYKSYSAAAGEREKFYLENLGNNLVRIKSAKSGYYLQSTKYDKCGFFGSVVKFHSKDNSEGADIWELRSKSLTPYKTGSKTW